MGITERIQTKLKEKGWSASELARQTHINQPTIHRILSGESREPKVGNLLKIAKALDVDPIWLSNGKAKTPETQSLSDQAPDDRKQFSKRLSSAIEHAGWKLYGSGQKLAVITLVTPKAANKWLNGEAMPGHSNMVRVAQALGVRAEWLEYGIGKMTETAATDPDDQNSSDSIPARGRAKRAEILDEHFSILQVETRDSNSTKFLLSRHTGEEFKVILDNDDMQEDEHRKIWTAARNREPIRLEVNAVFVDDTILTAHLISIL